MAPVSPPVDFGAVHSAATTPASLSCETLNAPKSGNQVGIRRFGVSDGIRTRDVQIHSLALYQAELRSPQEWPMSGGLKPDWVSFFVASGAKRCQ